MKEAESIVISTRWGLLFVVILALTHFSGHLHRNYIISTVHLTEPVNVANFTGNNNEGDGQYAGLLRLQEVESRANLIYTLYNIPHKL